MKLEFKLRWCDELMRINYVAVQRQSLSDKLIIYRIKLSFSVGDTV